MKFVLITGLSGAGKSNAVNCFEDLGYFCVDNLPPTFIPKFAELCAHSEGKINKVALVCDIRGGAFFENLFEVLDDLEGAGFNYEILFLEAEQEVLIRRFKETRRRHPLTGGTLTELLRQEKEVLSELRGKADHIINTSHLSPAELKEKISRIYAEPELRYRKMLIQLVSFGFKYGLPLESDLVFDVRFLPNPFYVEHLKPLKGDDPKIREYIYRWSISHKYYQKLSDLLEFTIPYYVREGKSSLVVAIGCTGGRHRSVVIVNDLERSLKDQYSVSVEHR
ncbi:MAG TPA: RNase adapter RapZ, partial [Firmicutes bacterium]|nr:RNase adapter RapZ [Bacillota bacterium]